MQSESQLARTNVDDSALRTSGDAVSESFKGLSGQPTVTVQAPVGVLDSGFMWPMAFIRDEAMRGNATLMAQVCERFGVSHAPHLKTAMSPELAQVQADAGAWGFTVGSASQVRSARAWGCTRILLANQSLDRVFLTWLQSELDGDPRFEFFMYVDSVAGADLAAEYLPRFGTRVGILLEVGHPGGRAGVREIPTARRVARALQHHRLSLAGVAGYEGTVGSDRTSEVCAAILGYLQRLRTFAGDLDDAGLLDDRRTSYVVSSGGSTFFDLVAAEFGSSWTLSRPVEAVLRSGCYLLHDHGHYAASAPRLGWRADLEPALEVWAQVLSCPEPGLVILNAGRRDVGFDLGLPVPLRVIDPVTGHHRVAVGEIDELNDQHAFLRLPHDHDVAVGELVALGISHPCTTMDKWRAVPVVDEQNNVIGYVRTYF